MGQCNWCTLRGMKQRNGPRSVTLFYDTSHYGTWVKAWICGKPSGTWFMALTGRCVCGDQEYEEGYHFRCERMVNGRKRIVEFDFKKSNLNCSVEAILEVFQKRIRKPHHWIGARFTTTNLSDKQVIEGKIDMKNGIFVLGKVHE